MLSDELLMSRGQPRSPSEGERVYGHEAKGRSRRRRQLGGRAAHRERRCPPKSVGRRQACQVAADNYGKSFDRFPVR